MEEIDVDEIVEVNYLDAPTGAKDGGVEIRFKDGTTKSYGGADLPRVLEILNHWTPPTA